MNLPNYFLADLPTEAVLRPEMVVEACQTLRRNRERFLLPKSTESVIQTLVEVARMWLMPHSPWMAAALATREGRYGFSPEMLKQGIEAYFRLWTPRNLSALVVQDLGHAQRLDRLVSNDAEMFQGASAFARGPELLVHVAGGALPTPVFNALLHGLLVRSAQFVKCASGHSVLARLFGHSLRDVEPKLASCVELAHWPGGASELEAALFGEADCVVASGADRTMEALRRVVPRKARFLEHGHRVSAGYVAREVLGPYDEARVLQAAAADVAAWDQLGCLSPHVLYVETGGLLPPEGFAARLGEELARLESSCPRGQVSEETAEAIFRRRDFYRVRAAAGDGTRVWASADSTAWTVVYEADGQFQLSCLHRFVYVKAVETLEGCLRLAEPIRGQWSTVGLAASGLRVDELAQQFADWGVTRICPLGRMQHPPLTWRHDGRPVLGDLVRWTNHERPAE